MAKKTVKQQHVMHDADRRTTTMEDPNEAAFQSFLAHFIADGRSGWWVALCDGALRMMGRTKAELMRRLDDCGFPRQGCYIRQITPHLPDQLVIRGHIGAKPR